MIIKLMGLLDILAGLGLTLTAFGFDVRMLVIIGSIYLLVKGVLTFNSFFSILDIFIGIILISTLAISWHVAVLIVASLILYQKGILSVFS